MVESNTPATTTSYKDQGNEEYKNGNWLKAAALYSKGIKEEPTNAVLYSNRSAALLKLKKVTKAMEDADECIKLRPDWEKGYFRKAAVFEDLQQWGEAVDTYQRVLALSPDNKEVALKVRVLAKLAKQDKTPRTMEAFFQKAIGDGPVATFALETIGHALQELADHGTAFPPWLAFLPGGDQPMEERNLRMGPALKNPQFLSVFLHEAGELAKKHSVSAVVAVMPKAAIEYPAVWNKPGWPCGKGDGVFIHVESKAADGKSDQPKLWFVPVVDKQPSGKPIPLDFSKFTVLLPILQQS